MNTTLKTNPTVAAIMLAFADCHMTDEREGYRLRNLNFRAAAPLPRDEAIALCGSAIPHGYNEFTANVLQHLPASAQVTIAREGSVCVYVKGQVMNATGVFEADELSYDSRTDETRIWWD